jgi:hypothetical protein
VQESSTPILVEPDPSANLTDLVVRNAETRPDKVVIRRRVGGSRSACNPVIESR